MFINIQYFLTVSEVLNSFLNDVEQREPVGGSSITFRINKPIEYHRSNNAHDGSAAAIIKHENCMPSTGSNDGNITGNTIKRTS